MRSIKSQSQPNVPQLMRYFVHEVTNFLNHLLTMLMMMAMTKMMMMNIILNCWMLLLFDDDVAAADVAVDIGGVAAVVVVGQLVMLLMLRFVVLNIGKMLLLNLVLILNCVAAVVPVDFFLCLNGGNWRRLNNSDLHLL